MHGHECSVSADLTFKGGIASRRLLSFHRGGLIKPGALHNRALLSPSAPPCACPCVCVCQRPKAQRRAAFSHKISLSILTFKCFSWLLWEVQICVQTRCGSELFFSAFSFFLNSSLVHSPELHSSLYFSMIPARLFLACVLPSPRLRLSPLVFVKLRSVRHSRAI